MDIQKAIEIIKTEAECVRRNDGKNCDRDCGKCDLLRDASEILEAYMVVISAAEKQIPMNHHAARINKEPVEIIDVVCPSCLGVTQSALFKFPTYCSNCGQALKWCD